MKLRRSFAFWAGVLVLGFLAWAWVDSCGHVTRWAAGHYEGYSSRGAVMLVRNDKPAPLSIDRGDRTWEKGGLLFPGAFFMRGQGVPDTRTCGTIDGETLHEIYLETMRYRPRGEWVAHVPYWSMVLAAAAGWGAVMLWRARRLRRMRMVVAESTMDVVV